MTWRYQPVWVSAADDERQYTLIEVYIDDAGLLANWTNTAGMIPIGNSITHLTADLARMLMDANLYKPVALSALRVGMTFERVGK